MKRLPYGISDFGRIITENYAYIDKTQFIESLEKEDNPNQFFIRPRKFGKSLFYSTLYNYYDLNKADNFERLFGDLYIGKHPTPKHNSYVVMQFDFSGLDTTNEDMFRISFSSKIRSSVRIFLTLYRSYFPEADTLIQIIGAEKSGIEALQIAYQAVLLSGIKLFVLIDEYDHFANDLIAMGKFTGEEVYRTMVTANGLVRDFYETLKSGTSAFIDRIFITGISPVMLNDLTSGFNIANNLTLKRKYNEMMGFTQKEVETLMIETGVDPALINIDMELYYNGYLFNEYAENRVYNPSMILYFFQQILDEDTRRSIIDENLKTDYTRIQRLIENDSNRETLLKIIKNNGIRAKIVEQFSIDRMYDDKYFVSLLLYLGLLTIDKIEGNITRLKIPNYSIQTLFWEYLEQLTASTNKDVIINVSEQEAAITELANNGNPYPYIEYVSKNIFKRLSNRDLIAFDEKYVKIMLYNGLFQSNCYIPISEMEVEDGYTDIYLHRNTLFPDIKYEWIWELKYIAKKSRRELKTKRKESAEQLEKYKRSARFANRNDIKFASIIFIGKDKYEINVIDN